MLLKDALPELAAELSLGFERIGRPDLAAQVGTVALVTRCRCSDDFCATFFTQPDESWDGREVERFILDVRGLLCLHTVDQVIARAEMLGRPEVRDRLRELFPVARVPT
jgi:hypothetical protein